MLRKIFNRQDYPRVKYWIFIVVFTLVIYYPVTEFISPLIFYPFDKWMEARHEAKTKAEERAFQEEVTRRRAERKETDNNIVKTPHVSPVESVDTTSTESTHVAELPQNSSDPPSRLLPSGPYKGMTPEEVQAFEQREREFIQRNTVYVETHYAAINARLQNSEDRESLMLSVFKSLSPELLKHVREESFKKLPAEDVEDFFNNLENKGIRMTDDQLIAEGERILTSDQALDIVFRELAIEEKELEEEYKELYGEEAFNEVYGDE